MFERRDQAGAYRQQATASQRPQLMAAPQEKSLWEHPLVVLGIGGLLVYAVAQLVKDDDEPRKNPAPAQAPVAPVFMMPSSIPVSTTADGVPSIQGAPASGPTEPTVKKRRVRRTTQARGADGTFKTSGTRKRAVYEGKEKKK